MDLGGKLTANEQARLEKRIAQYYRKAEKELSGKIRNYFAEFEELDAERKGWVDSGKWTKQQYEQWRLARMANGKRFVSLRNDLAERMTNSHGIALEYINDAMPRVYALNHNFTAYMIEKQAAAKGMQAAFNLYDEATIKNLIMNNPDLMPEYNPYFPKSLGLKVPKDLAYGKQQITSEITSGILQGKSVFDIADSLQHRISTMNRTSAVRAARTAMTAAQNGGRMASYREAEAMGIKLKKQWLCTNDYRTRDSHASHDGETVDPNKKFSNGLMYPGDPAGAPAEVYNCRCTMIAELADSKYKDTYINAEGKEEKYQSYQEWYEDKKANDPNLILKDNEYRAKMNLNKHNWNAIMTDEGVRFRRGYPVEPSEKTLEQALDPIKYATDIAQKYNINLKGSGKRFTIEIDYEMQAEGKSKQNNPTVIYLGRNAFANEEMLATTIAHEVNHARSWLKGGKAPERTARRAERYLREYIRGIR